MRPDPGTYALVLRCDTSARVRIGRWGHINIEPGFYIYVGSALGPGGIRARVLRHCRRKKTIHWHIDYLRPYLTPYGAWFSHEHARLECNWAGYLITLNSLSPVKGFGCSDCRCFSHLFWTTTIPDFQPTRNTTEKHIPFWFPEDPD